MVQFSVSDTNKIGAFRVIQRMNFNTGYESGFGYTNEFGNKVDEASDLTDQPIIMNIYGEIADKKDNLIKVDFYSNLSGCFKMNAAFTLDAQCKVYLVNRTTGKIEKSSVKEAEPGDVIVARRNYHIVRDMIIFR